jgi:competence protein ComEC
VPFLRAAGISTLDALVLTHPDEDHLGGAIAVLSTMRVRQLLTNGARDARMSARDVWQRVRAQRIPSTVVSAGMAWHTASDLRVEVIHPPQGFVPGTSPPSNDNSVVMKLTHGSVSLLLTGDLEEAGLPWTLRAGEALRSTVLKVPHHGSRLGAAGEAFFRTVRPRIALLSVGRAHHLPASETMRALEATGARLFSTREDGAISLRTDGRCLQMRAWNRSRRWRSIDIDHP